MPGDFELVHGTQCWRCKDCQELIWWDSHHADGLVSPPHPRHADEALLAHMKKCSRQPRSTFTLGDVIWWNHDDCVQFPRIGYCTVCHGVKAVAAREPGRHGIIHDPQLAYAVFLLRHGHWLAQLDHHFDADRSNLSHACTCVARDPDRVAWE